MNIASQHQHAAMDAPGATHDHSWTPIGETSHQLIVYHPPSHAIQVVPRPLPSDIGTSAQPKRILPSEPFSSLRSETSSKASCPLCGQRLPPPTTEQVESHEERHYFRVLEQAHESSRPSTPVSTRDGTPSASGTPKASPAENPDTASPDLPAMGYYRRFFREEGRLGIGAEGSVYLATHVISGNELGTYAVKKIAVGTSHEYLVRMLREVKLLETLRHPNIIPYYHSWVDETRFSSFGPPILALHVLMMYATAGNLDAFLLSRSHAAPSQPPLSARDVTEAADIDLLPKAERIKAFKRRRQSGRDPHQETRAVLFLGLDEILKLFGDIVEGLTFLHSNSILHLDLKCSNVLLHWEEGQVIPKAILSDFGTSEEMLLGRRDRTGHTGTMEYMAPETLVMDTQGRWRPSDSHADMWSLGMVLYRMTFLQSPYRHVDDLSKLHGEIIDFAGFQATPETVASCGRRHIPQDLLRLLERLLHVSPELRPSADRVKTALQGFKRRKSNWRAMFTSEGDEQTASSDHYHSLRARFPKPSSPVRPLLALPPVLFNTGSIMDSSEAHRGALSRYGVRFVIPSEPRALKLLILVCKVISLQPSLRVTAVAEAALPAMEVEWSCALLVGHMLLLYMSM